MKTLNERLQWLYLYPELEPLISSISDIVLPVDGEDIIAHLILKFGGPDVFICKTLGFDVTPYEQSLYRFLLWHNLAHFDIVDGLETNIGKSIYDNITRSPVNIPRFQHCRGLSYRVDIPRLMRDCGMPVARHSELSSLYGIVYPEPFTYLEDVICRANAEASFIDDITMLKLCSMYSLNIGEYWHRSCLHGQSITAYNELTTSRNTIIARKLSRLKQSYNNILKHKETLFV